MSSKRKTREPQEDNVTLGPEVRKGEQVFGVAHIFVSFNDTFIHVADLSGREILVSITGAMLPCLLGLITAARRNCTYDQPRQTQYLDLYTVAVDGKCECFQCSYKKRSRLGFGDSQLSGQATAAICYTGKVGTLFWTYVVYLWVYPYNR